MELATETALRYAAKLCALPANPFCRINWQLFAARGETRQTLFTSRQKKAATLHAAKKLALALSLSLFVSIFLLQRLQVAAHKFADPFRAILYALKHAFVKSKFYGLVTLLPRQHDKLKQLHGIRASRVQFFHFYGLPTSWELQL